MALALKGRGHWPYTPDEGFDAASPVTSFTAADIEAEGTINMAQVVQNLTFNNGTGTTNSIQGSTAKLPTQSSRTRTKGNADLGRWQASCGE